MITNTIDPTKPCQRQLKIHPKRATRNLNPDIDVSEIRLIGKWLEEYGFKIGITVTLNVEHGKITIVPDEPKPVNDTGAKKEDKLYQHKMRRITPRVG